MPVPAWGCSISCTLMLLVELKPLLPSANYRTIHSSILLQILPGSSRNWMPGMIYRFCRLVRSGPPMALWVFSHRPNVFLYPQVEIDLNTSTPNPIPSLLVYCGENDLASGDSITAAVVVQRFKTLFGIIRQNLPNTVIGFVSIKPSPVRAKIQDKVKEANRQIKAWIKTQPKVQFIDIYDRMLDARKQMREEL